MLLLLLLNGGSNCRNGSHNIKAYKKNRINKLIHRVCEFFFCVHYFFFILLSPFQIDAYTCDVSVTKWADKRVRITHTFAANHKHMQTDTYARRNKYLFYFYIFLFSFDEHGRSNLSGFLLTHTPATSAFAHCMGVCERGIQSFEEKLHWIRLKFDDILPFIRNCLLLFLFSVVGMLLVRICASSIFSLLR